MRLSVCGRAKAAGLRRAERRIATLAPGATHDGRDSQFESSGEYGALAFLHDDRFERRGDRADAGRVRARGPRSVPGGGQERTGEMTGPVRRSWTGAGRERAVSALPPEKLLPDRQPAYMASWIYVFGVLALTSLVVIIAS